MVSFKSDEIVELGTKQRRIPGKIGEKRRTQDKSNYYVINFREDKVEVLEISYSSS